MSQFDVIAIIPARGGSKRLPRKNIAPFFGKPLLQYTIEACKESKYINKGIFVSTEDPEIAAVARELGAQVIHRPMELAEDKVWTQEVLKHAVSTLEKQGVSFHAVARIHCTPQVDSVSIDEALDKLKNKKLWEVFSVDEDGIEDAVIHVLKKDVVHQEALSVYKGVIETQFIDVHTPKDLEFLERQKIEAIEKKSHRFLKWLANKNRHSSPMQELLYILGRSQKLWQWQLKSPLWNRWQAMVHANLEFQKLLYSREGYIKAKSLRVLDLGCGFGMYWPVLQEYGFRKFVGIDLFDLRKKEGYFEAAKAYVKEFCDVSETQLIMDDARNLHQHRLMFAKFDVIIAVATESTKLGSTAIPKHIFDEIVREFGSDSVIPVYVGEVQPNSIYPVRQSSVTINSHKSKPMQQTYVIGEIGQNHNGSVDMAKRLIDIASMPVLDDSGRQYKAMNAIKLQKRDLNEELTASEMEKPYDSPNSFGKTYGEHRAFLELSEEQHAELYVYAKSRGLDVVETICSPGALSLLNHFKPDRLKVASRDLTHLPLLEAMAKTGIPMILSTGMAGDQELDQALAVITKYHSNVSILHCLSQYPAEFKNINLKTITYLQNKYPQFTIGYSDHSVGIMIPAVAVGMGAEIIEKHITLNRGLKGSDHHGSLAPDGVFRMMRDIRHLEESLGEVAMKEKTAAKGAQAKLERSVAAKRDLVVGEVITEIDIHLLSPGTGLRWTERHILIGKQVTVPVKRNELILHEHVQQDIRERARV